VPKRLPLLTSRRLIWLAGFALIASGIVCLFLSGAIVGPGWWQGTLDAFGVGFVVGGIVDVLAISLMNQVLSGASGGPRNLNRLAENVVAYGDVDEAQYILERFEDKVDPLLRSQLRRLVDRAADLPLQGRRRHRHG
jgi:hypothetical protein